MRALSAAVLALAVTGCVTVPQHPSTRPLNASHIEAMRETPVVVNENTLGVTKSWFMQDSSAAGASQGLLGVLVAGVMDAIINAGPSMRARKAATEINEYVTPEAINQSLVAQLRAQMPGTAVTVTTTVAAEAAAPAPDAALMETAATNGGAPPVAAMAAPAPTGVVFAEVTTAQKILTPGPVNDAIEITTSYVLSEDASVFRMIASVSYQNDSIPYATPYTFEGAVPRTEQEGPLYRNTFTYYSTQLPIPTLTPELRERLIANIQASYADENGAPPAPDSDAYRAMERELDNARDNNFTRSEIAIFLTREWLRDGGSPLRQEIETAHAFLARYIARDLNSTAVPSFFGQDELLETMADNRTVRRVGAGYAAGSYISSPGSMTSFASFGNAIGVAPVNMERTNALVEQGRDARRATRRAN